MFANGNPGRPCERRAHHRERAEHIRPHEHAPGRQNGAEVVAHQGIHASMTEGEDETQGIADQVRQPER